MSTPSCKTGIVTGGQCDDHTRYPVPSSGASSFYTTWSLYVCWIACGLLVVYLSMVLVGKTRRKTFQTNVLQKTPFQLITLSLIAMPAINSIGVLLASQLLLSKNFKLVSTDKELSDKSITTSFFQGMMDINFNAHIVPGLLGIVILLGLGLGRQTTRTWQANLGLACSVILLNCILVGVWMAVPENSKQGIDKIKDVYNDPPGLIFVFQFLLVCILAFMVAFKIA